MLRALLFFSAFTQSILGQEQRLVKLNVVATDKQGRPVSGLGPSGLRIREDGKPQQAVFFRARGAKTPAPTIIVLDRWNERMMTLASAWNDLRNGLQSVQPGDPVYVYFLNHRGDLVPVRPLPGPEDLPGDAKASSGKLIDGLDQVVKANQGFRGPDALDPVLRANLTFGALGALCMQIDSFAGRKNLVWVTHGVPLVSTLDTGQILDYTRDVKRFAAAAARSQIAIYAVDQSSAGAGADVGGQARQTLQMLTSLTGGRWYNSNSGAQAIADSVHEARNYYTMAYYSPLLDRKSHKIRVDSERKGLQFVTRDSYDGSFGDPEADASQDAAFGNALRTAFDAAEIGVSVTSLSRTHVSLHVDPADLLIDRGAGHFRASVALQVAEYNAGALKDPLPPVSIDIDQADLKNGIEISRDLRLDNKVDQVRFFVFDRNLHALGSVSAKVP